MDRMVEDVQERFNGIIIRSTVRLATTEETNEAKRLHSLGQCPHNIVIDEPGWLYDIRHCAICGQGLGTV